jgi:hypothetical protein
MVMLIMACLITLSSIATVSAAHGHDWSHERYHHKHWRQAEHHYGDMPFRWHANHDRFRDDYRVVRIHDHRWANRFPGLHAYEWHGDDFWYGGRHINHAILFYDDDDRLVSVGFNHNGGFIFVRDDDQTFISHDSFFLSWRN